MYGNDWTENLKLVPSSNCTGNWSPASTNCTWFDLVSSSTPDYIEFKVKTSYENGLKHLSPKAWITIAQVFTLSQTTSVTSPNSKVTLATTDIGDGQEFTGFKDLVIDPAVLERQKVAQENLDQQKAKVVSKIAEYDTQLALWKDVLQQQSFELSSSLALQTDIPEDATEDSLISNEAFTNALKQGMAKGFPIGVDKNDITIKSLKISRSDTSKRRLAVA